MRIIGLTGGIATGKSLVCSELEKEFPVYDCDKIARQVVEPGTKALTKIKQIFTDDVRNLTGEELILVDGTLNRKALGRVVFADETKRKLLTDITGKAIFYELLKGFVYHWLIGTPTVIVDAPTLYESKFLIRFCSKIVLIATTREVQLDRLMNRDSSSREEALARIRSQIPIDEKAKMADQVIWNESSKEDLLVRSKELVKQLKNESFGIRLIFSGPGIALLFGGMLLLLRKG